MNIGADSKPHNLNGLALIIVEDDFVVAQSLADLLEAFGAKSVDMASNIDQALSKINTQAFDAAVLDVNLLGGNVEPVALKLEEIGVPFLFVTGYASRDMLPEELQKHPVLLKPVNPTEMLDLICDLTSGAEK
ncbi:two-component response regulator [Poriferisphaera corsica]|uniref:Two-component response regulator n=1 Tax=Poriferisphaera corsica TaxID=2528020 RepID=A0A517YX47_9BACT|nr:response regulator [Poriferisphaera corsica]QDU34787.1 two-component response regulator [Poriferisphaera corsica]